jgi:hypothetical protein
MIAGTVQAGEPMTVKEMGLPQTRAAALFV